MGKEKLCSEIPLIGLKVETEKMTNSENVLTSSRGGYESSARLTTSFQYLRVSSCLRSFSKLPLKRSKFELEGEDITQRDEDHTRN